MATTRNRRARPPKTTISILDNRILYRCPICRREFRTILSLIGHGISAHKVNLLALEQQKKIGERRSRRTELAYIKLS